MVTDRTGIKIPLGTMRDVANGIYSQIDDIIGNRPERIENMSQALLDDHERFSWERRCESFLTTYGKALP